MIPGTQAWRRRRTGKSCAQALEHLHELVDEELPDAKFEERLKVHLSECGSCMSHVEAMRELKTAVDRVQRSCDPELSERLLRLADELLHGDHPDLV
jgi:hypothetical protein